MENGFIFGIPSIMVHSVQMIDEFQERCKNLQDDEVKLSVQYVRRELNAIIFGFPLIGWNCSVGTGRRPR